MTKRVLVLNHFAVPRGAAGGTRHVELFDRLPEGWDYTIIASDRKNLTRNDRRPGGGKVRTVPTSPYNGNGPGRVLNWTSYALGAFAMGVTRRRVDAVYGSSPHLLTGLVAWAIAQIRQVPFILEIRDLWPQVLLDMGRATTLSPGYQLLRTLERFLYLQADEIVVLAQGTEAAVRRDAPVASISFIPNGSDPAMWEIDEDREALRDEFGFDGFVAIYAGAHGPANGLDAVLSAAEEPAATDVTFVLIGGGLDKERLMAEAERRGLGNVRFYDPVSKSELARLFAASDVGLHVLANVELFRYGVSPNKLFDYMAAGLPVITNTPGTVSDLVIDADAGVPCEPDGLGEAVAAMAATHASQRRKWGANGREFVAENRSREVLAAELAKVLERAVGRT